MPADVGIILRLEPLEPIGVGLCGLFHAGVNFRSTEFCELRLYGVLRSSGLPLCSVVLLCVWRTYIPLRQE